MLLIHAGLPRTSTTSLQAVLTDHEALLGAVGVMYPKRWRPARAPTHHEFHRLLTAARSSSGALDGFRRFLIAHSEQDILISAEGLIGWLQPQERREALQRLLTIARETMPTRWICTLRRRDELVLSLYLKRFALKGGPKAAEEVLAALAPPLASFSAMRTVEEILDGDVVYVKYQASGAHNRTLIDAFRIPEPVRGKLHRRVGQAPRLNAGPSQKLAIALFNLELLAERAGARLDPAAIKEAHLRGELVFDCDRPWQPVDTRLRRKLHEDALAAARMTGFAPYAEFFADEEVVDDEISPLDLGILDSEDVQRVVAAGRPR